MKLSDGAHTLVVESDPPSTIDILVSGNGLIVEEVATGRILTWDEEEGRYKAPEGWPTLVCAAPNWFCRWEPGLVQIGHVV